MRVTIIDLDLNVEETFHVHAEGCADITRSPIYSHLSQYDNDKWTIDAESRRDVVDDIYGPDAGSFYEESGYAPDDPAAWREYAGKFRFFPCVKLTKEA